MRITGKRFYFSLNEQLGLLRESQESKSQSAAKKLVMQRLGYDEQEADKFVRLKLRNDLPALRKSTAAKFTLAATKMFLDRQLTDAQTIVELNTALAYAANEKHYNEFDRNLNGLSAQDFINMIRPESEADNRKKQDEVNNTQYTQNNDYDIVRIDSFEQAQQYGNYTSWCITHRSDMWDSYTVDGINQFYFCLIKGFESVPKEKGENCPLDEYGLSMVAVSVNPMGGLKTCTCRWNHDNGGNDNIMDERQISQMVGRNFYSTFKPSEKGAEQRRPILSIQKQANLSDEDARKIKLEPNDDGTYYVELDEKQNILTKDGKFMFPNQWFDYIEPNDGGTYTVKLNRKYNILTKDGKLKPLPL